MLRLLSCGLWQIWGERPHLHNSQCRLWEEVYAKRRFHKGRYIKIILLWIVCKAKSIVEGWRLKRGLRLTKVLISRTQTAWCLARGRGPAARWRTRTASAEWASITRGRGTRALALASQMARRQKQECSSDKCPVQGNTICVYTERWKGILSRSG